MADDPKITLGDVVNGVIHDTPEIVATAGLTGLYVLGNLALGRVPDYLELAVAAYASNVIADPITEAIHPWLVAKKGERSKVLGDYFDKFKKGTLVTEFVLEAGATAGLTGLLLASGWPVINQIYDAGVRLYQNLASTTMMGAGDAALFTLGVAGVTFAAALVAESVLGLTFYYGGKAAQWVGKHWVQGKYSGS